MSSVLERALVTFEGGGDGYHAYLHERASPLQAANMLADTDLAGVTHPAEALAAFLGVVPRPCRPRVVNSPKAFLHSVGMLYDVRVDCVRTTSSHPVIDGVVKMAAYSGPLAGLPDWAKKYQQPDALDGHVIRFWYEGGTAPGWRVVTVESVVRKEGKFLVCGKDVKKGEHRNYDSNKIRDGKVEVLD